MASDSAGKEGGVDFLGKRRQRRLVNELRLEKEEREQLPPLGRFFDGFRPRLGPSRGVGEWGWVETNGEGGNG
eukprot:scaffold15829_cov150-Isochrysis_galbana.AAC.4